MAAHREVMRRGLVASVSLAFFTDQFLYGLLIPLASKSPAKIEDEWALAVMFGAYALGLFLSTPVLGVLADRHGRRWPLIAGVFLQGTATLLFALGTTFTEMFVARVIQGVAVAATWTAGLALLAEFFAQNRTKVMGFAMMGSTAGSVAGPLVGGVLMDVGGYAWPFIVGGTLTVADACMRLVFVKEPPRDTIQRSALGGLLRDRLVLASALIVLLAAGGWNILEPLLPGYLARVAGVSSGVVGFVFTTALVMYGVATPFVDQAARRYGLHPTMVFGLVVMAVTMPLIGLTREIWLVTVLLSVVSVSTAFTLNSSLADLAEAVDRRGAAGYGSVYAVYNMAYALGSVGSDVLAGGFASTMSFMAALLITSAAVFVCMPLLYIARPAPRPVAADA